MPTTSSKRVTALLLSVIAIVAVLGSLYTWFTLNWSYSEGDRAGYLQSFSKKGWLCKTWEGEILLSSMPGAIPERFAFTVRDDAVAKQLNSNIGRRVQVSYQQHKGVPTSCFGDTEYFVKGVVTGPVNPVSPSEASGAVQAPAAPAQPAQ
jgi:hypothetical protein